MKRYGLGTLLLLAVITLASCAPALSAGGPQTGDAKVDSIEIRILESFPVQVQVIARGFLPDGCTTIDTVSVDRQGNTFTIRITTQRPADAICTQEVVPFEHTIPLDVQGLQAGTYTVEVNGVQDTFELATDNVLSATPTEPVITPAPRPTTDDLPKQPEPKAVPGLAEVESVTVHPVNSDLSRVKVIAKGYLRDGCTKIDQVNVEQRGDTFMVVITTKRPSSAMCTQALVPFEQEIELSVGNLPAGTYNVVINQQHVTLELPLDR